MGNYQSLSPAQCEHREKESPLNSNASGLKRYGQEEEEKEEEEEERSDGEKAEEDEEEEKE